MFEKYGRLKHFSLAADFPSGYKVKQDMSYHDAFLSYISPLWNYAGSGIEGMVCTHTTRTMYAPIEICEFSDKHPKQTALHALPISVMQFLFPAL